MGESAKRWIIRDASGRVEGPFTTEKVLYKIGRGEFSGEEFISLYPNGRWIPISQDPDFYDKLLEVISKNPRSDDEDTAVFDFTKQQDGPTQAHSSNEEEPDQFVERKTSGTQTQSEGGTFAGSEEDTATDVEGEASTPLSPETPKKKKRRKKKKKPQDIELVDLRPQVAREMLKNARGPAVVFVVGMALVALFWFLTKPQEQRIHLIGPQKNIAQVDPQSLRARIQGAVGHFVKDSFDGYMRAQNDFVYIIERNNKNAEAMALLCMTYLQLWPYAYQDSHDTKVIGGLLQMSAGVDPGGQHSSTCRAVDLIVRARFQEAKGLVESILDARASDSQPPILFFFLKGFLLESSGDHAAAMSYMQSAQQLWPQWVLPYVVEAQAQVKMENFNQAGNLFRKLLKEHPSHSVARIELGLLEYKYFNRLDLGERYLTQGLELDDAPRPTLSRGWLGLAEIALARGDQGQALKYAQRSYSINASNAAAKNLIVQIGGVQKLKATKIRGHQLVFEGDQFFREGDCHTAQAHYKAAFEEDQKNALAALKAAQCLWKLSFSTEAIDWLNRAIRADPKLIESYVTLAEYQAERYNFLAASRVLDSARKVNPKSHEVYRGFALVELKRGNAKGALAFGKTSLQLYEQDVETLILMAEASLALRDPKTAYNYASQATQIDVNHRRAQIVFAQSLAGLQGIDVGLEYLSRLVENYPLVTEYRLAMGRMNLQDERYQVAQEIFRQIVRLEEKPKAAYVELAKVLKADGHGPEALDFLLKAAVLDPSDAEPLYLAGISYLDMGKPQEASVQFNRVLTINKLYPLVQYQLGRAALMMNDPKTALNYAETEKRMNPNLADPYLLAAEAHTLMQQYSNCATEYQKAIKLRPQQAMIYVRMASCWRKAGNLDAAVAMLAVANSKESGLADIYKEQGAIFEMKGDVTQAIESYNQYFILDPDAPDRAQIEERISTLQRGQTP